MSRLWRKLSKRDRIALVVGTAAIALALVFLVIVEPLLSRYAANQRAVARAEADLVFIRDALPRLEAKRGDGSGLAAQRRAGRSLLALADATAREANLGGALKRVEPIGDGRVSLWFEGVGFDAWIAWLEVLSRDHGVGVETLALDRIEGPGMVNARVVLVDRSVG